MPNLLQALSATLLALPEGEAGTRATLRVMASLVREYRKNIHIRTLALEIVGGIRSKDWAGEAAALTRWVQRNIRYVRDVTDVETVQTPLKTIDFGQGDCDDHSTLLSALLQSIGFETRFLAIKTDPRGPFVHVVAQAKIGRDWVALETTEPWEPGHFPIRVAGAMVEKV